MSILLSIFFLTFVITRKKTNIVFFAYAALHRNGKSKVDSGIFSLYNCFILHHFYLTDNNMREVYYYVSVEMKEYVPTELHLRFSFGYAMTPNFLTYFQFQLLA